MFNFLVKYSFVFMVISVLMFSLGIAQIKDFNTFLFTLVSVNLYGVACYFRCFKITMVDCKEKLEE